MVATTCHTDGRLLRNFKFASSMDTVASCNSKLRYRKPLYAESLVLPKDPIVNVLKCIMKTVKNGLSGLAESSKLRAFLIVSSCFAASEVYGADTEENADHCGLFIHWRIMTQRILSAVTDEVGGIDDPDRLCFNVEVEEHNLGDLNEPANYKAALSDPEFKKWLVAMNPEMKSMYDNKV
ncbi:hypothetical protein Tco_1080042 [Tanacetum coccineum]|uniref:Zinc finger, CCHC-type n=1 Tax=Tanacetum coccineum TaxID=301880 RepID=A0ABQ5HV86_9ASTR